MATAEPDLGEEYHKNCSICPNEASSFCQDCDKYFCATCLPVHATLLPGHTVLGSHQRSEWGKQKEQKSWKRECKEHAGQVTCMYCSKHDIVCCPVCAVQKHGFWCYLKVSYIPDIAKGLSGSFEYRAHLYRIDKVAARFNATEQKLRERGRAQLHDSKVKGTKVMKELIERIDKLLNALVIGSLKKLESTVDGLEKANEREIDECVTHAEELAAMKKELSNSENSDEVEMFICMKTSQKQISKLNVILDALENKPDCPTEISVDDNVEKAVKLLEKAESLGTLPSIQKQEKPISKGFSGNEPAAQAAELSPTDLVVSLAGEVTQWEAGMMWPFTCFGFEKENITLPGFTDLSFEELRFEAYEAKHSGTMAVYIQKVQALYQEVNTRRQELKAPNMTMKQKLISFIEGCRKQTQSSSGNQAPLFSCDESGQKDTTQTTKVPPRRTKTVRHAKIIKPVQKRAVSSFSGISTTSTPLFGTSISSTRNTLSTVSPISGVSTTTSSVLEVSATVSSLAGSTTTTATTTMACDLEKTNSMCAASATRSSTVGTPTTSMSGAPAVTTSMSGTQTAEKTMPPGLNTGARDNSSRTDNLSLLFHQVHGKGVELSGDSKQAKRDVCIFDCSRNVGICFSNRPIAIGEHVYVKFEKDSLSTNSLYVGLTRTDPGSLNDPLPNSWISMGNLGHLLKLVESLPKDTFKLFFYITRQGVVFYGVDEKEIGWLFHGIETNIPYWAMIDIRGLGWDRSIEFVKPSIQMEDSMGADQKGTRTSACIPTMGHQQFKQRESKETRNEKSLDHPQHCQANTCTDSSPILLHTACRKNVSVSDDQMTATKQIASIDQGYFFTTRPMEVTETLVFEMQDIGESNVGYFYIGFTSCDPTTLQPEDLPTQELLLRERAEYWALSRLEAIMDVGTKFHLYLTQNGQVQCCTKKKPPYATNNHAVSNMMVVDTSQPVWAFFVMRGDLQKIKIIAVKDMTESTVPQHRAVSAPSSAPAASTSTPKPSLFQAGSSPASCGGQDMPGAAASMLAAKHQENTSTAQTSSPSAAPTNTPQKTIIGGFSFTSTPKITEPKAETQKEEMKATPDAPKSFTGFSQCHISTELGPDYFKAITEPGQTMSTDSSSTTSTGSDDHVDEYEPNVDFKPVVPLPDLVEVKTGEEDEEKMFGERAKLFRYDTESKQWKERGIGEIKILRHKTTNMHRILMRREQVLKLCANHKITEDLKLGPMSTSEKAWVWTAADFSEGEVKTEKLAVRFKNQEIAVNFKKTVEACQETMKAEEAKVDEKKTEKKEEKKTEKEEKKAGEKEEMNEPKGKTNSLASLFKQKAGSWTCSGCYVPTGADILQCPCCNTMKPGVTKEDLPKKETPANTGSSGSSGFTFGSQQPIQTNPSGGLSLAPNPADSTSSQPETGGFRFGSQPSVAAATSPPQTGGFMFGSSASTAASTTASASPFGKPAAKTSAPSSAPSIFKFGDQGTNSEAPKESASSSGSGFKLPEPCKPSSGFTFGGAGNKTAEESPAATSAGFNVNKDASLYTFGETSKPVEEKTKENQTPDVSHSLLTKYISVPDNATADGENEKADEIDNTDDTVVVKKEEAAEIARLNGDTFDENENVSAGEITLDDNEIVVKEENDATAEEIAQTDDVFLVKEEHATPDEVSRARGLQLPDHFFLYRLKPACPGCRGCEEDCQKSSDQVNEEEGAAHKNDDYDDNNDDDDDDDDDYDYYYEEERRRREEEEEEEERRREEEEEEEEERRRREEEEEEEEEEED